MHLLTKPHRICGQSKIRTYTLTDTYILYTHTHTQTQTLTHTYTHTHTLTHTHSHTHTHTHTHTDTHTHTHTHTPTHYSHAVCHLCQICHECARRTPWIIAGGLAHLDLRLCKVVHYIFPAQEVVDNSYVQTYIHVCTHVSRIKLQYGADTKVCSNSTFELKQHQHIMP